jgi:hypothetical protein
MSGIFFDAMQARPFSAPVAELEAVKARGQFFAELSILSSLAFAAVVLFAATYEFRKMDY